MRCKVCRLTDFISDTFFSRLLGFLLVFATLLAAYPVAAGQASATAGSTAAKAQQLYLQARQQLQQKRNQQAAGLLADAAKLGNRQAQYRLGLLYARGAGVTKDLLQARILLEKAALQGHPKAQFYLGQMYLFGDGGAKDPVTAAMWFWLATSLGDRYAKSSLRVTIGKLSVEQFAEAKNRANQLWSKIPRDMKVGKATLMH